MSMTKNSSSLKGENTKDENQINEVGTAETDQQINEVGSADKSNKPKTQEILE